MSEEQNNLADFNGSSLSARIDAQIEVYRKISTDYSQILNALSALDSLKKEIASIRNESKQEYKEILIELNKVFNKVDTYNENIYHFIDDLKILIEKQHIDISKIINLLEKQQQTLEEKIKVVFQDLITQETEREKRVLTAIKDGNSTITSELKIINNKFDNFKEENGTIIEKIDLTVKSLYNELILKKKKLWVKLGYILGTLTLVWMLIESLTQVGIIKIIWFK